MQVAPFISGLMTGAALAISLLYSPTISFIESVIHASYRAASDDCRYRYDNIGLKRLSIEDLEKLL